MLNKMLVYGLIAGLIVAAEMLTVTIGYSGHMPSPYGMIIGYLTMLIALSVVFVGIKKHRDADLGGVIGFWQAFGFGLGVSFIASVLYVAAWEVSQALMHADFASVYAKSLIAEEQAKGVTGKALEDFDAQIEQLKLAYQNQLYHLPITFAAIFPVGVIVSLTSAAMLRNRRFLATRAA